MTDPTNERRKLYATAMHRRSTGAVGTPWERVSPEFQAIWLQRADAAIAVSDEEQQQVREDLVGMLGIYRESAEENARLRTELDDLRAVDADRLKLSEENVRLSEENTALRARVAELEQQAVAADYADRLLEVVNGPRVAAEEAALTELVRLTEDMGLYEPKQGEQR